MNFNPQTAFRRQPMVYITMAFIIGILLSEFLNASSMLPFIAILLLVIFIIIRKWNFSFVLIVLFMVVLGFSFSSYKNDGFYKSLDEIKEYADKPIEYSGIVVEKNNYSSGQRFTLKNIQIKSEDLYFNKNIKYFAYPKDQFIDKLADTDFEILINNGESIKSDVLKMTYPKQIPHNFNEFVQTVNPKMTIITGAKRSKNYPTQNKLDEIFNSKIFFTDSVGAVWLFSDGKNPVEVKEWK